MKNLTWIELRGLYKLYNGIPVNKGSAENKSSFRNHPYIKLLYNRGFIKDKLGNDNLFVKEEYNSKYDNFYREEFINRNNEIIFEVYFTFLEEIGINTNTTRIREIDIHHLMDIKKIFTSQELVELKKQIKEGRENRQGISKMFFKANKYIKKGSSLETATLKLLEINRDEFYEREEKDKQYLYKLYPKDQKSRMIVLCENLYFLKFPHIVDEMGIELWYAGGNNITKLERVPKIDKPIFYSCDWDYHGLGIYERAKKIIESNSDFKLVLLTPDGNPERLSETEDNHSSQWEQKQKPICGLTLDYYSEHQQRLIEQLKIKDEWIEEEGCNLINMLQAM